ncbi:hypothetical protein BV898_19609 [Hypsibius exemplaris]|uniref:Uncharacterized protein n=1 Tax=Hypsibius exemplaris TaxID=2072580 RepID=A0A9X6RPX9_HYPEX|nr:hypothetical protein BV898_19609 [Hypsibius exemplaris]
MERVESVPLNGRRSQLRFPRFHIRRPTFNNGGGIGLDLRAKPGTRSGDRKKVANFSCCARKAGITGRPPGFCVRNAPTVWRILNSPCIINGGVGERWKVLVTKQPGVSELILFAFPLYSFVAFC